MKQVQFDTRAEIGFLLEFVEYEPGFAEAAAKVGELVSTHVIARPHEDVEALLPGVKTGTTA